MQWLMYKKEQEQESLWLSKIFSWGWVRKPFYGMRYLQRHWKTLSFEITPDLNYSPCSHPPLSICGHLSFSIRVSRHLYYLTRRPKWEFKVDSIYGDNQKARRFVIKLICCIYKFEGKQGGYTFDIYKNKSINGHKAHS